MFHEDKPTWFYDRKDVRLISLLILIVVFFSSPLFLSPLSLSLSSLLSNLTTSRLPLHQSTFSLMLEFSFSFLFFKIIQKNHFLQSTFQFHFLFLSLNIFLLLLLLSSFNSNSYNHATTTILSPNQLPFNLIPKSLT